MSSTQLSFTSNDPAPTHKRLSARNAVTDNLAALELLSELKSTGRTPTAVDIAVLEGWHGWGAAPQMFDEVSFETERGRLRELLGVAGYDAARRTVLNAHYTGESIVRSIWDAVPFFGVTSGLFIEPGCGRGTFLSSAPAGFSGLGIELDAATAEVAELLVGDRHSVVARDFGGVRFASGAAVLAIGNVPFGRFGIYDAEFNSSLRISIHDHFIVKSLAALAPGGIAMFVTSRYTLDKRSSLARAEMGKYGDFLGAARLNSSAFTAEAGTDVVTDVVVFRRRSDGEAPVHASGFLDDPVPFGEKADDLWISAYFSPHPDRILGEVVVVSAAYGLGLDVIGTRESNDQQLTAALASIASERKISPVIGQSGAPLDLLVEESVFEAPIGRIELAPGGFRRFTDDGWILHSAGVDSDELVRLIEIRDLARSLVALERATSEGDQETEARRTELANAYGTYVDQYGPINRVKINGKTDRRTFPKMGGFRTDPDWPRVAALEFYDEATGQASPATILNHRVVTAPRPIESTDNPSDALAVSIAERGYVDMSIIASLLGCSKNKAIELLGDLIYEDPENGQYVDAPSYLSGNVRKKLAAARQEVAAGEGRFARNVAVLEPVIPLDLGPDDLDHVIGASWISEALVVEFARSLLPSNASSYVRDAISVAFLKATGEWIIECDKWSRNHYFSRGHEFGLAKMDALKILQFALNGRAPVVTERGPDNKEYVLPDDTQAAIEKAELLAEAFDFWLLREDKDRATAALRIYNDRFNSYVPRNYKGCRITAPGLASDFKTRDHQHEAIARILMGGSVGVFHDVGLGKTAVQVIAGLEMKRLGMIERPLYVVPNNMLSQFATEICRLYPDAEVLVVDKDDVNPKNRELFAARVRSHAWDAVVITHSSFTRWGVSPEVEETYIATLIWELREELAEMSDQDRNGAARKAVKVLERRVASAESRLEAMTDKINGRTDDHDFFFDDSGIDFLFVDEADEFKNVEIHSSVRNLRGVKVGPGSQRAFDLGMKINFLAEKHPDRQAVFSTGTPISNTIAELWAFMRYLRPDLLRELGVYSFDAFRMQFADTVSAMELDLTRSYRRVERLARYKNVPELVRVLAEFADIVSADDVGLQRPAIKGGRHEVILVDPSPQLEEWITGELIERVEAVHQRLVRPEEDNMLKLSTEARLASFDWYAYRGENVDPKYSTLVAAAENIASIYHKHAQDEFKSEHGGTHPRRGALQAVFSDLSTPKAARHDTAYDRLRAYLVGLGVPVDKVAFSHEYDKNDETKARLQEMCRDGRIAVVVSSTQKLGVGVNIQPRMVAIHYLDCPWRPRDLEQRKGRGVRQGNQHKEIEIYAYATARSYAVYGWQTLERKAGFIGQIMRSTPDGPRFLVVSDEEALSYGEVKAIATGDPDFLRVAEIEEQVARLSRLQRSHARELSAIRRQIEAGEREVVYESERVRDLAPYGEMIAALESDQPLLLEVGEVTYETPNEAAKALVENGRSGLFYRPMVGIPAIQEHVYLNRRSKDFAFELRLGSASFSFPVRVQTSVQSVLSGLKRVVEEVSGLQHLIATIEDRIVREGESIERLTERLDEPFAHAQELDEQMVVLGELRRKLEERYSKESEAPAQVAA